MSIRGFMIGLALVAIAPPAWATSFEFFTDPIMGEDPAFIPDVTATFEIEGSFLKITLTNDSPAEWTIGQSLSGVYWDITTASVLTAETAMIGDDSALVGFGLTLDEDLSGEWGFKDDVSAGTLGSFGISSVGDILLGADSFGPDDRFNTDMNLFPPPSGSLNGSDASIVGPNITDFSVDGFASQGPFVQNEMVFRLLISGEPLTMDDITNVQVLFGSDGAPLVPVPEPTAALLFGIGVVLMGERVRRQRG